MKTNSQNTHLAAVLAQVPLAKRLEVADHIKALCKALGDKTDYLTDRRKTAKRKGPSFICTWRSSGKEVVCENIADAAKLANLTMPTLRVYLARGKGRHFVNIEDDVVTITRISA